jgi:hypothetical protein
MSTLRVPLHQALDWSQADELARRVHYVSAEIVDFALVGDGEITAVDLVSARPLDQETYTEKLHHLVANDLSGQRVTRKKVIWTSPAKRVAAGRFDELVELGMATTLGEGQVAVGEPVIGLMDYFDRRLTALLREHHEVAEFRYPTLVPTSTVEACGYFSSFPQYLMLVTRLHNDLDVYRDFQRRYAERGRVDASVLDSCANVDYCLPPTMCFHTFGHYRGAALPAALTVVTAKGKSFRFESRYSATLERLWDFTIREMVFMGPKDLVVGARRTFMTAVFATVAELGLSGYCEVGNDPFFCHADTSDRVWSQRFLEQKYELRLAVGPDRDVAVGSFNFHDDFFGLRFGITCGDRAPATSGCVGFGLERLVYAFLCQYGLDAADWPRQVRDGVAAKREESTG